MTHQINAQPTLATIRSHGSSHMNDQLDAFRLHMYAASSDRNMAAAMDRAGELEESVFWARQVKRHRDSAREIARELGWLR